MGRSIKKVIYRIGLNPEETNIIQNTVTEEIFKKAVEDLVYKDHVQILVLDFKRELPSGLVVKGTVEVPSSIIPKPFFDPDGWNDFAVVKPPFDIPLQLYALRKDGKSPTLYETPFVYSEKFHCLMGKRKITTQNPFIFNILDETLFDYILYRRYELKD